MHFWVVVGAAVMGAQQRPAATLFVGDLSSRALRRRGTYSQGCHFQRGSSSCPLHVGPQLSTCGGGAGVVIVGGFCRQACFCIAPLSGVPQHMLKVVESAGSVQAKPSWPSMHAILQYTL